MKSGLDIILIVIVVSNILLLGTSRLGACIRVAAVQGGALGILLLVLEAEHLSLRLVIVAVLMIILKCGVFPHLLHRTLRDLKVQREIEPFVGYGVSILFGPAALAMCIWLSMRLQLPHVAASSLVVSTAFFTIATGLFIIATRKKALTQVLGYLIMENGIFIFGAALVQMQPLMVELGILLDVFVAVFVMGIAIFHINREFDHIDTDRLTSLRS